MRHKCQMDFKGTLNSTESHMLLAPAYPYRTASVVLCIGRIEIQSKRNKLSRSTKFSCIFNWLNSNYQQSV
ncbi:hypothetical protein RRG08_050142 [Elysia crispata]|uniref:Uncharacterized protein n=1 Tax=Elysia crispata TaxID=231223 RepID=A0AAE0Z509_9GAST|nr:hypothetical protein RRG08_050142 [Elysia crispata]